jgi:negative regulator of flagellin synthesis FlgM
MGDNCPRRISVTNKISGYSATEPLTPVKGSSSSVVADRTQSEANAAPTTAVKTADQVTLTSSARTLQRAEETIAKTPVVDTSKVDSVKQRLSAGTYQIDAGRVADKLLQYERGLN